jgi:hypothetical protein
MFYMYFAALGLSPGALAQRCPLEPEGEEERTIPTDNPGIETGEGAMECPMK